MVDFIHELSWPSLSMDEVKAIRRELINGEHTDELGVIKTKIVNLSDGVRDFLREKEYFKSNQLHDIVPIVQQLQAVNYPVHRDKTRKFTLLYTFQGPVAATSFYEPDSITLAKTYRMKLNTWYLFNATEPHGVDELNNMARASLVVKLDSEFQTFQEAVDRLVR